VRRSFQNACHFECKKVCALSLHEPVQALNGLNPAVCG